MNEKTPFDNYMDEGGEDFSLDHISELEQIEAHLPNIARLVALYYKSLLAEGMEPQAAFWLTRDYSGLLIRG